MQSSTPASSGGETPWLLFIGILAMALVPALSSFMRLREFEGRLEGTEIQAAKAASESGMNKIQIEAHKSHIDHLQKDSLPAIGAQLKALGALEDKLAAAVAAQAELQKAVDAAGEHAAASATLLKEVEGVDGRLDQVEKGLTERLTKDEWDQLRGELVKAEEFRSIMAHLKEGQRVEIGKACEALLEPLKRAVEERLGKAGADQAALTEELKKAAERLEAQAKQIVELMARVDDLAKKATEKPPEPPK